MTINNDKFLKEKEVSNETFTHTHKREELKLNKHALDSSGIKQDMADVSMYTPLDLDIDVDLDLDIDSIESDSSAPSQKLTKKEMNEYAEENIRLIAYVLKGLFATSVPYDELYSVGSTGYAKALINYDKGKGVKFSTYAYNCIRNEILFFLRKENKHIQNTTSLNKILSVDKNGNNLQLEEIISQDEITDKSLEDRVLEDEERLIILKAIGELSDKEKKIIMYRFGLDRGIKKTQKELAEEIGMSQANVSKIQEKAIKKLKIILKKYI